MSNVTVTQTGGAANAAVTVSRGLQGATGPNSVTTSTSSNLTGFISANGTAVSGATAGATAATANTLALRDATGGSNFAAVGASSVTSSGAISTTGAAAYISTSGENANIYTGGEYAAINTSGANAYIATSGANAYIFTAHANAYIQSRSTFRLYNGTHTTTLSHSPTADRAIVFPDKPGTVAMVDAETHTGAHAFSSTTRPTSGGTGTPAATSLITTADGDARYFLHSTNYITQSQTKANNADFTGASTLTTIPRITCAFLPSSIRVRACIMFTTAPAAFATSNFDFILYTTNIGTANMSTGTPLTIIPSSVTKVSGLEQYIIIAEVSAADISTKYSTAFSTYGVLSFLNGCELRNKTGGSLTTVSANAGFIALEIYR